MRELFFTQFYLAVLSHQEREGLCEWLIGGSFAAFRRAIWVAFNLLLSYFNKHLEKASFVSCKHGYTTGPVSLHTSFLGQCLGEELLEFGLVTKFFYVTWVKLLSSICQIIKHFE